MIGGFTEPQGDREHFGALVLGVQKDGKLRWVGNVGTGFDQKLLASLYARLEPLITTKCPFAERPKPDRGMTWVKPELVCQVKYANWTPDDRLRAPVFVGLRNDKPAAEVAKEAPGELLPGGQRSDAADRRPLAEVHESRQALLPGRRRDASATCSTTTPRSRT